MNPIEVLPNPAIDSAGIVSQQFRQLDLTTFHQACYWVKNLPYGSNSSNDDSSIIFPEKKATCTNKHGIISRLAEELDLEIYKNLGFYRLDDAIVTGVNAIVEPYGLSFIPQIHCFLEYQNYRVDLTEGNCNGKNKTIEDYDFIVQVKPDLTHQEHEAYYLEYLEKFFAIEPKLKELGVTKILELLKQCEQQLQYQCSTMYQTI
ncbi:MAG: hypothetical protein AAGE96_23380 [Cyanobacteria bacterium P01_G01_bin.19]